MASPEITSLRYNRTPHPSKQKRSGYEPSDTETEWQDDHNDPNSAIFVPQKYLPRNISPLRQSRKVSSKTDDHTPRSRHSSKSPYKPRKDDVRTVSPISVRRNVSPFSKSEHRRKHSPFKPARAEDDAIVASNTRKSQTTPSRDERGSFSPFGQVSRASERSSHTRRSATAPRQRIREKEQENHQDFRENNGERTPTKSLNIKQRTHAKSPSVGEINEMVANMKFSTTPTSTNAPFLESTDSISPGDIFFSRDHTAFVAKKTGNDKPNLVPRPPRYSQMDSEATMNGRTERNPSRIMTKSSSRSTMSSSSAVSNGKFSTESGKTNDTSRTSLSSKRFTENRKKSQAESWFSCMKKGNCRTSRSPEKQSFTEASFIEKAFVVETLRQFWADKYQPTALNGFICHKQEAQLLKQLASHNNIPHILLKGPSGSGKRSLARALLCEIFGNTCRNISHDLRYFQVQEQRAMQVAARITSSAHHVELNVDSEPNAKYALMGLVKEISSTYATVPEVSTVNFKPDYKVLVLYQVDKAAENVQHLIKWIMDCYTDACKLIICCEDDVDILESVTNRCKVIKVDAPVTHEIMEVLIQIARKEEFELSMNFAARIAAKSKQNLRRAIMTLEACKAHNYPFVDDQPIPSGWEEVLIELAADILTDPSQKRLFLVRGKFQKLLVDFVHPKLILLKLVEQFLEGVDASSRRELYYWHAYYDKRIPTGSTALLKLEEFVAKFMSMHRKSLTGRQYI
ncbi:Replication factor C subunit 5 [Euphorbia peplus]|nr:Replication factor C subunit 5 [Euphorbia peplus]